MKKYLIASALYLALSSWVHAQPLSKVNFSLAQKLNSDQLNTRIVSLFVQGDVSVVQRFAQNNGGRFKYSADDISSIELPLGAVTNLASMEEVKAIEDNHMKMQPLNDSMRVKNNINPVQNGMAPLPQGYNGNGVIMGIIDSGIDFTHPDFKDTNGNSRVLYLWDHNLNGSSPLPYNYGREFNATDINNGLASSHVDNSNGHGTHVTGVAAGNGQALNAHKGVAPNSQIISVCVNWNLPDDDWMTSVADAVNYIYGKANALGKPCVINISAGSYYGSHDAKDLQAQIIGAMISQQNGRSLVCAAGNAGEIPIHVQHLHTSNTDTSFTWFNFNASYGPSIYVEMWADQANFSQMQFTIGADKNNPSYEFQTRLPFYDVTQNLGAVQTTSLFGVSGSRIARVQRFASLTNGRYSMIFNIIPDSSQYAFRLLSAGIGKFDVWSFQMTTAANIPTVSQFPEIVKYVAPDLNQTIVSGFTCSNKVITVGEHKNRTTYMDCNNNLFNPGVQYVPGQLAAQSSHGPTRDNRLKPEITASGGMTLSAGPAYVLQSANHTTLGQGCMHMRDGGTSTASPVVAGIAALILERYPQASWQDIKNCITQNVSVDSLVTGTLPNNAWGFGKANGFAAMLGCSYLSAKFPDAIVESAVVAPNPFQYTTQLLLDNLNPSKVYTVEVRNVMGQLMERITTAKSKGEVTLGSTIQQKGIYFYNVKRDDVIISTGKMVKN